MSTKEERVRQAEAMRDDGMVTREIAEALGVARSTVTAYLCDPDLAKQRRRRLAYRGTCARCGGPTDGSNGPGKAPEHCASCQADIQHESRRWTREAVIDAIRRFAAEHGRPPVSTEWLRSNREKGYPGLGSVYRSRRRSRSPFASWADAVEAAGFPRPLSGAKRRGYRFTKYGWTQREALDALARYAELLGGRVSQPDMDRSARPEWMPSIAVYERLFGSLAIARLVLEGEVEPPEPHG